MVYYLIPINMARGHPKSNIRKSRRQPPGPKVQGKQSQGIQKQQSPRKSLRLQAIRQSHKQSLSKSNHIQGVQAPPSPPPSNNPESRKAQWGPQVLPKPSASSQKWKRGQEEQEAGHPSSRTQEQPPKRLRTSPASDISEGSIDPLEHWIQTGKWRKEYFEQDSQVREDFERGKSPEELGQRDWLREHYTRKPFRAVHAFTHLHHLFARKKSSSSLGRKKSQSSLQTPSDQLPREVKSAQYRNPDYAAELEDEGSYMYKSTLGITDISRELCRTLLEKEQTIPQDTLFRDDLFDETCRKIRDRNETMVIRDIGLLIVPSAQTLATYGATHLNHLYETTNQGWNSVYSFPLHKTRPQPDFSVGFGRSAFTQEQLNKLKPFVGDPGSKVITYFMATTRMYFPFLTCEVKCGASALDIADRQNAHSMTVAVRAIVELFKSVKREKELDREILAFSVSHDHRSVRIYGHYPVIEEDKTTFYRHPIHKFSFTALDGKEKWTAYKFTKNVYDTWMPKLHKLICSAIDDLPAGINFALSQSSAVSESTHQSSQQSNTDTTLGEDDSQSSFLASQEVTPTMSFTQATEPAFKKPRNKRAGGQQR
ncbi:hypothetical protein ABVK25_012005 [Lepraria finkii]|uniref:DUF7924 domain-containing protein n=1 Tax=Lepraria finkii TaxID=1340010 RepID=A0ABR4AKY5_9LECA